MINNDETITILSGASESATGLDLSAYTLMGLYIPAEFDGTTLTLKAAPSVNGAYVTIQSAGADYTITTTASRYVPIETLAIVAGIRFLKITTGTAQTGDTVITPALREVQ